MSINDFLSNTKGLYRPNRFKVSIDGIDSKLEFHCRATTIPANDVGRIDVNYQGMVIPIPGDNVAKDWSVTVFCDTDFKIRNDFEIWRELIRPQETPGGVDTVGAMRTASVDLLDTSGKTIRSYKMIRCFPTSIGALDLTQDSSDTIATFDVTFALTAWVTLNIIG